MVFTPRLREEQPCRKEGGARGSPGIRPKPVGVPRQQTPCCNPAGAPAKQRMPEGSCEPVGSPCLSSSRGTEHGQGRASAWSSWGRAAARRKDSRCRNRCLGQPGTPIRWRRARTATTLAKQQQKQPVLNCLGPPFPSPCAAGGRRESPGRSLGWGGSFFEGFI